MEVDKQNSGTINPVTDSKPASGETAAAVKPMAERTAAGSGESIKETLNQAKDAAGQAATQVVGQAKEKASSLLGEQKTNLAAGINTVADSIRQIGENLQGGDGGEKNQIAALAGKYGDSLAGQVEKISHYVEDKNFGELARDAEHFARRNPAVFVGGAFALGILAARFLKSSGSQRTNGNQLSGNSNGKKALNRTAVQAS